MLIDFNRENQKLINYKRLYFIVGKICAYILFYYVCACVLNLTVLFPLENRETFKAAALKLFTKRLFYSCVIV